MSRPLVAIVVAVALGLGALAATAIWRAAEERDVGELPAEPGAPASSEATSTTQECGNKPADGEWTYGEVEGAGHFNLTARNVPCDEARAIVDRVAFATAPPYEPSYPGWSCRYVSRGQEFTDIRCTSGDKVVRWQSGA